MNNPFAIDINQVSKQFPACPNIALNNISLKIHANQITGLIGPDGAGKTTLLRLISGLLNTSKGNITVCGLDSKTQRNQLCDIIGYMPQKFGLYEDLTVMENLQLYAALQRLSLQERTNLFDKMLHFTALKPFTGRLAGKLSGGMKQKLGLACALLSKPSVLLLDEPSVGVDPISRRELWQMVQSLCKESITVIWSTAYLDEAEKCSQVILLNEGNILFEGAPENLTATVKDRVFQLACADKRKTLGEYLKRKEIIDGIIQGKSLRLLFAKNATVSPTLQLKPTSPRFEDAFIDMLGGKFSRESILAQNIQDKKIKTSEVIQAINLSKRFDSFIAVNDVNFTIKSGEIFGLLGPNGAGKSTTFKMLCGLLQPTHGQALISGIDLSTSSSKARAKIGYMAQKFSLYSDLNVLQNLEFFSGIYGLIGKRKKTAISQMIDIFDLKPYLNTNAGTLPLGFKQRLALSCALMHEPDVLFLDEPTSGVDPLTRREFWTHINGMVQKGVTIMITTHFLDEAEYCDRVSLIYKGQNIATNTPDGLKAQIQSDALPNPTLEDAFIALIEQFEQQQDKVS